MFKKSQAAMEFLMTYGWALIVVLVAIAALAFFGVLNPGQFLPERCSFSPGLTCTDFSLSTGYATIMVLNGIGDDISDIELSLGDWSCGAAGGNSRMLNGKEMRFICPIDINSEDAPTAGSKMKKELTFSGKTRNGLKKVVKGEMIAVAEEDSLNDGLVLYMPFNKYESIVTDYSENNNIVTLNGALNWTSKGAVGGAYSFDSVNDYIKINKDISLAPSTMSAFMWINANTWDDKIGKSMLFKRLVGTSAKGYFFFVLNSSNINKLNIDVNNNRFDTLYVPPRQQWLYLGYTYDGHNVKFYVNGQLNATSIDYNSPYIESGTDLYIGYRADAAPPDLYFNGTIDEVRIYNRALSANEVKRLYELGKEVS